MLTRRDFTLFGLGAVALTKASRDLFGSTTTPPSEGSEIRRVKVRVNGAYWGAGSEQIDMLSGNLSFCLPLVTAKSRLAAATITCSYNSQVWKKDQTGLHQYGPDLGFGVGWRVQVGSVVPERSGNSVVGYRFVDGTGAEYPLTQTAHGWVSLQGMYITYDPASARLQFPDGTVWILNCVSGPGEADAGARYPTIIQDANGNQIIIRYMGNNSSARIQEIQDARAVDLPTGRRTYLFTYSADKVPHLLAISSHIGTGENYQFSYTVQQLRSPFGDKQDFGLVPVLQKVALASGQQHAFAYNTAAEMVEADLPPLELGLRYRRAVQRERT
jgi:hypothetical protein